MKRGGDMKRALVPSMMFVAVVLISLSLAQAGQRGGAGTAASAVSAAPATAASAAPRMADGHPDLSGVWWGGSDVGGARGGARGGGARGTPGPSYTSLYRPEAAAKAKTLGD